MPVAMYGTALGSVIRHSRSRRGTPNDRAVSIVTGSTSRTPYIVWTSSGQNAPNAARKTSLSRVVPSVRKSSGISAADGIGRRNSIGTRNARPAKSLETEPDPDRHREHGSRCRARAPIRGRCAGKRSRTLRSGRAIPARRRLRSSSADPVLARDPTGRRAPRGEGRTRPSLRPRARSRCAATSSRVEQCEGSRPSPPGPSSSEARASACAAAPVYARRTCAAVAGRARSSSVGFCHAGSTVRSGASSCQDAVPSSGMRADPRITGDLRSRSPPVSRTRARPAGPARRARRSPACRRAGRRTERARRRPRSARRASSRSCPTRRCPSRRAG